MHWTQRRCESAKGDSHLQRHYLCGEDHQAAGDMGERDFQLFKQETEVMSRMNHRGMIRLHSVLETPNSFFLIVDELLDLIKDRNHFDENIACCMSLQSGSMSSEAALDDSSVIEQLFAAQ
jgi:hypothetical protein